MEKWETVATALADIARDLLNQTSVDDTLDRIVANAVDVVEGCTAASVMQIHKSAVSVLVSTGPHAKAADQAQAELGEGPCFDAIVNRHDVYRIADTTAPAEWPALAERLRGEGIGSAMGFLLRSTEHNNLGALNLYAPEPAAFGERSERVGHIVAAHCAVALATARRSEGLERALHSSRAIGIAVGVLMTRYRITSDEAFDLIVRYSQDHNVSVRKLAADVERTGDLPS